MPPTTAELVHDRSLGDLLIHREVVLDGLSVGDGTSEGVHHGRMVGVGVGVDSGEDFVLGLLVDHAEGAAFSSR
ncbi:hypothetical protein OG581_52080 [Streptomyces sp. NBC_01386]|uniref:hypothetical protein n=1 Tax=Streptomyces sp. NBC_01386 TaxID=2903848 RepID=UPI003254D79E